MERSMLWSNSESASGVVDPLPMPWIHDLIFTLAGGSGAELVYDKAPNLLLETGFATGPLQ